MAHGGRELDVRTGLLAPIFDVDSYSILFRVSLVQVFRLRFGLIVTLVNSHLASRIPASQGPGPDQLALAVKAATLASIAWLVIVRHPYTSHKPLSPTKPSPFALLLPRKHPQRHSLAPYHPQQKNPRTLQHKMWIVDWCTLMPFHHPYARTLWPARRIPQTLQMANKKHSLMHPLSHSLGHARPAWACKQAR